MNQIIKDFYTAFNDLEAERMVKYYHDDICFEDPAFGKLYGERAKNMWRMLCDSLKGKEFKVTASNFEFTEQKGKAIWEAFYTFSKTGRKIHNIIEAKFEFQDGKIIKHTDNFDLYSWSKQAFGLKGLLIGWSSFFKNKLQSQTNLLLTKFENIK